MPVEKQCSAPTPPTREPSDVPSGWEAQLSIVDPDMESDGSLGSPSGMPDARPGPRARVLVLEDDPVFRDLLVELLADEGFEVALCDSYAAVREAARDPATGIVLADFWGTSHARLTPCERDQIRELASQTPTILLTARAWGRRDRCS
jgi:PleD family two-component response regulator